MIWVEQKTDLTKDIFSKAVLDSFEKNNVTYTQQGKKATVSSSLVLERASEYSDKF
jgi:hypothetical protein